MKITYIHHSSFLVETDAAAFLFDYYEGDIPETGQEKPLFVFASHRHGDHFSPVIFKLAEEGRDVWFVLSDDIWKRNVPRELLGRTVFLGPGESEWLESSIGVKIKVETFKSTDEGVAFLLTVGDKVIYHAGDLNNWVWAGEPGQDNERMSENFHREMKKLSGRHIDVAFMLIDPRQEKDFYLGMDDFMRMAGAEVVFPMHFWGDFDAVSRFKSLPCAAEYKDRIQEIQSKGQTFII